MKAAWSTLVGLVAVFALVVGLQAADKAEVTKKGKITCAKCDLGTETKCTTVIVVPEGGKDVTYYLDKKSGGANHKEICKGGKPGTVTGTVSEKDGKKIITASSVKFD